MDAHRAIAIPASLAVAVALGGCAHLPFTGDGDPTPERASPAGAESAAESTHVGSAAGIGAAHPLRPGDRIRVSSWREEALTDEFVVDEEGTVVLPLLGPRKVTDRPANEVRAELVSDYEDRFRNHTVGVTLLRRVSILGAVNEPGIYHVDPTMTVSEAVALAGGSTDDGKMDEIEIVRDGQEVGTRVSRRAPLRAHVRSGDEIVVPKRNWFARNAVFLVGSSVSALTVLLTQGIF